LIHVRVGDTRHQNRKCQHRNNRHNIPLHALVLPFFLLLIVMDSTMPPIPLMILAGFDPILPAAAGTPGVTVMRPVPAAATSASEHEEEEQSPKDQPDQPSSNILTPFPVSVLRTDCFRKKRAASVVPVRTPTISSEMEYLSHHPILLSRQEIEHFLHPCGEYSPLLPSHLLRLSRIPGSPTSEIHQADFSIHRGKAHCDSRICEGI
jgi:hypothetical protein